MLGIARRLAGKKPIVFMMAFCGVMMLGKMAKAQDGGMNPKDAPQPPGVSMSSPGAPDKLRIDSGSLPDKQVMMHVLGGNYLIVPEGTEVLQDEKKYTALLAEGKEAEISCRSSATEAVSIKNIDENKMLVSCITEEASYDFQVTCERGNIQNYANILTSGATIACVNE